MLQFTNTTELFSIVYVQIDWIKDDSVSSRHSNNGCFFKAGAIVCHHSFLHAWTDKNNYTEHATIDCSSMHKSHV